MFERFTERARQVVVFAQDEARSLRHNYVGTEHLLLGLLREDVGMAARVLEGLDITVEEVRAQVQRLVGPGDARSVGQIPFTPRAKKVLELSLREAVALKHSYISTEHILLGLAREDAGVAARILLDFDADADTIRRAVSAALEGRRTVSGKKNPFEIGEEGEALVETVGADAVDRSSESERAGGRSLSAWHGHPTRAGGSLRIPRHVRWPMPLLLAIGLAALGFPLGLLVGFLIWG